MDTSLQGSHARIAPSSLHLTVPCPGSVRLQESMPPIPQSDEAAEGDAAHAVAMWRASGTRVLKIGETFEFKGKKWVADADMVSGAELWARECSVAGRFEDPVEMPQISPACYGTPDYWRYQLEHKLLEIKDYKFGFRFVDVFENYQLVAYAFGVAHRLSLPPETIIRLSIVQPRAYHVDGPVRGWATTLEGLTVLLKKLRSSAALALTDDPPTRTGSYCLDCKARAACRTLQLAALNIVEYSMQAERMELTHDALGTELRILEEAAKRLDARKDGLAAQVEALLRGGIAVPYYGMKPGRANLAWREDVSVEEAADMAALIGVNILKPAALLTPTQAKDLGVPEDIIGQYSARPTPKLILKADDTQLARRVFDKSVSTG